MRSEAQKRAQKKYLAKSVKELKINLHVEHDKDVIAKIEQVPVKREYILSLIRADLKKNEQSFSNL